jgi:aryl-alcohol dehydrogenase-like predicted oxidoreductase
VQAGFHRYVSRRAFLGAGACALAAAGWPRGVAAQSAAPLIQKIIPVSGERLPAIGLGTDAFRSSEREAIQAEIKRMVELGGTVIDTAAAYGDSEMLIGASLAALGVRERVFLATKLSAGGLFGDALGGQASFRRSLARLQTSGIDLLQVHNLAGIDSLMPMLQGWKKAGQIRYFGATTSRSSQHAELVQAMRTYPLDFIQVDYSIANRDAAEQVLPLAIERRMAVLINLPFARASLLAQAGQRQLPDWAASIDVASWGQFLLKYVISHPAVTCAIPGSTKLEHLQDNQLAARGRMPDPAMRRRMEQFWDAG